MALAAHSLSVSRTPPPPTRFPQPESRIPNPFHLSLTQNLRTPKSLNLSLRQSSNQRPISASVLFSLPTANPERVSSTQKDCKWSAKAIKAFALAELEARKFRYATTGPEALLLGVLLEATNLAAKILQANGFTISKVREESVKLLPRGELTFRSPTRPPLTEQAQMALDWAVDEKLKSRQKASIAGFEILLVMWWKFIRQTESGRPGLPLEHRRIVEIDLQMKEYVYAMPFNAEYILSVKGRASRAQCLDALSWVMNA